MTVIAVAPTYSKRIPAVAGTPRGVPATAGIPRGADLAADGGVAGAGPAAGVGGRGALGGGPGWGTARGRNGDGLGGEYTSARLLRQQPIGFVLVLDVARA